MAAPALSAIAAAAAKALRARLLAELRRRATQLPRLLFYLALLLLGLFLVFLLFVLLPILFLTSAASTASGYCGTGSRGSAANASDPIDLPALEIATRIYEVGREMKMGEREILTAYTVALVESGGGTTMVNVQGGDRTSTGVFQQQSFPEWTQGPNGEPRNRNNVSDAARTFFERLRVYDEGQEIGELAADIQRPQEDLRWKYGAALPRARYFYERVAASIRPGDVAGDAAVMAGLAPAAGCGTTSGPANLAQAETLEQPRELATVPAKYTGGATVEIDARILDDVVFIADHYGIRVSQGLGHSGTGSPSVSHNYGTATDLVPANSGPLSEWQRTTERLARDLGWNPGCGRSGSRPACPLVPAIRWIGYNGYPGHGDPTRCSGACPAHLHVSWECSCGPYDGRWRGLSTWIKSFPPAAGDRARDERL